MFFYKLILLILIMPLDRLTSRRKHIKPTTNVDIAAIKRIARCLSRLKLISVAINIMAIKTQTKRADIVVSKIAIWVHQARQSNDFNSPTLSFINRFSPSLITLKRSTIRDRRVDITVRIAPMPVSRKAGATAI